MEPDPLLPRQPRTSRLLTGVLALLVVGLVITVAGLGFALSQKNDKPAPQPAEIGIKNVILLVSDGCGPASQTFARSYIQAVEKKPWNYQTPLDTILVGTSRTRSTDSLVTDSSAGATAFACGYKTDNRFVGLTGNGLRCETVLESAKKKGMRTGLVATTRITHATPASFVAHVNNRDDEATIALQEVGKLGEPIVADVLLGGGQCYFVPGSRRKDGVDVTAIAREKGYKVVTNRTELLAHQSGPVLGLFSCEHMSFELDRDATIEPSLPEMMQKALDLLQNPKGFFLMVEGSKIDLAGHNNDAGSHLHEILVYQNVIQMAKDFAKAHPGTVIISVSDHETGGLTLGKQLDPKVYPIYRWYPERLVGVRHSTEWLARGLFSMRGVVDNATLYEAVRNATIDAGLLSSESDIDKVYNTLWTANGWMDINYAITALQSDYIEVGWTTQGHTGVDVNLYTYPFSGVIYERLRGNTENTDIAYAIAEYLQLAEWPKEYNTTL